MKKMRLDPDTLEVQSFQTAPRLEERGTVIGQGTDALATCRGMTCDSTCFQRICTCTYGEDQGGTCDYSCDFQNTCGAGCPTGVTYPGCNG